MSTRASCPTGSDRHILTEVVVAVVAHIALLLSAPLDVHFDLGDGELVSLWKQIGTRSVAALTESD